MQDKITKELKASGFSEVSVKDSNAHTETMYLSGRSLVLTDSTLQNLYVLTPVGPYTHSIIEKGTYVIDTFVYSIDKVVHRTSEQEFFDILSHEPPKRYNFIIEIDDVQVYQSNSPSVSKRKLKDLVKSRKNPKEDHFGCKKIVYFEPENKTTQWAW